MTFKESYDAIVQLNIDHEKSLSFKAAVLIMFCVTNENWNVAKVHKASAGYWFTKKQINFIFKNFHDNDLIIDYLYFNHDFTEEGLELVIQLTLFAGLGAGVFHRYAVPEQPQKLLPEYCQSLICYPIFQPVRIKEPYVFYIHPSDKIIKTP